MGARLVMTPDYVTRIDAALPAAITHELQRFKQQLDDVPRASVWRFLQALHTDGVRELRAFNAHKRARLFASLDDVASVDRFLKQHADLNIYIGVATRRDASNGALRNCSTLASLFVDLDFKNVTEAEARVRLASFPIPPSMIVASGGGLHVYWFLVDPIKLPEGAALAKALLCALADALGGDRTAAEPTRVLRVPDTLNHKAEYGAPRGVVLEELHANRRYKIAEFEDLIDPTTCPSCGRDSCDGGCTTPAAAHTFSLEERLRRARQWIATQPPAIEGQQGDQHTFSVAAGVAIGHDLNAAHTFEVMQPWNKKCQPPWSDDELRTKIRNAERYGEGPRGQHLNRNASRRITFVRASEVTVEKIVWLWQARLACGAITLFEGGPERGKSTILADLAARVSHGHSFPGETDTREPGNVVMMIAEDDIAATVVPRLIAAEADLTRIFFLSVTRDERGDIVPFHLSDDCERLRLKCQEVGGVVMVVVDPLVSFLGSRKGRTLNTYNDLEVRKALAPLKELAEQIRASVVAIRHYRKGVGTNAMEAGGGSVAFAALVRVIIAALPDPEDESTYLLAVAKNNLVVKSKRPALAYDIVPATTDPDIGRIEWGETVEMSANEILAEQAKTDKDKTGRVGEATEFLITLLASGKWVATNEIMKAADANGISKRAVQRAKEKDPSIVAEKEGTQWGWRLEPLPEGGM